MGRVVDGINAELATFIEHQPVFFVSTAPLAPDGHINVSPKGLDSLRVIDEHTVVYLDLHGSGVETIAHVRENGRICVMIPAFSGRPNIVRLHGRGEVLLPGDADFDELLSRFPPFSGVRALVRVAVSRTSTSCGFGVPRMEFVEPRDDLVRWAEKKGDVGLAGYRAEKNVVSIDGLPGMPVS
jgi:hypothetical protein